MDGQLITSIAGFLVAATTDAEKKTARDNIGQTQSERCQAWQGDRHKYIVLQNRIYDYPLIDATADF